MGLTKNARYVDALRKVKKILAHEHVADTSCMYICNCLDVLFALKEITERTRDELQGLIVTRLDNRATLSGWLASHKDVGAKAVTIDKAYSHSQKLQATRHRWVDALIEEFS